MKRVLVCNYCRVEMNTECPRCAGTKSTPRSKEIYELTVALQRCVMDYANPNWFEEYKCLAMKLARIREKERRR